MITTIPAQCVVCPGHVQVGAAAAANITISLPSWQVLVINVGIQVDDLDLTIDIRRSDTGNGILTDGAVACTLLGAADLNAHTLNPTIRMPPFFADRNCTLTFACTDISGVANDVYIAVFTRKWADIVRSAQRESAKK